MSTFFYARNSDDEYIFGNFPSDFIYLVLNKTEGQKPIELHYQGVKEKARFGYKTNNHVTIFVLTTEDKYVSSFKMFKELLKMSIVSLEPLSNFQGQIILTQNNLTQELVHNLTSLNGYSIQGLFSLIPPQTLSQNLNKQSEIVKSIIAEKPNVTASTLLKLIKYNLAMKVEFSVFERTLKDNPPIQKMEHSIREIILSILQIFMEDFGEMEIEVSLDACEKRLNVDYDSLLVSLYYILENSIKYCCNGTKFKIIFKEESDSFSVLFIMVSIKIEDYEISNLFVKGYRGENAKTINKEGNGIGMYRILKTLKLNNAILEITPRINSYSKNVNNAIYQGNQFKLKFNGQQDWFKVNMA